MKTRLGAWMGTALLAMGLAACGGEEEKGQTTGLSMGGGAPAAQPGTASETLGEDNSPPTITSLVLRPDEPRSGERLTAVVETQDLEGDSLRLDFRWTVGGQPIANASEMLVLSDAKKGDQVRVEVVARDSQGSSDPMEAYVMVGNQIPVIRGVVFEPLGEVSAASDVTASPRGWDADEDEISYEYEWSVNGMRVSSEPMLSAERFQRGDEIVLSVVAYDGDDRSDPLISDPITVANAAPKIVSDPEGFDGGEFNYRVEVADPDNDRAIRYHLEQGPNGMRIDGLSGIVSWQPSSDQEGRHRVKIRVEDQKGGSDQQAFDLTLGFESGDAPAAPVP